ncbi:MAG TPA: hypothetical protein VG943_03950, partial [Caulobacterales bacterium]|nr:hypothetical protein [Caulobacterales bacterium]
MSDETPASNAAYDWSKFDSEAYFQHYYGDPHPDDDHVVRLTVEAFKALPAPIERSIDIGTGPNLFPLFSVMPRAASLTAWEYAESNVAWLKRELDSTTLRPQWRHWWGVARAAYGEGYDLPDNPIPTLKQRTDVRQGSI